VKKAQLPSQAMTQIGPTMLTGFSLALSFDFMLLVACSRPDTSFLANTKYFC